MPQTTQSASQETSPTSYGYCSWHQGQARGVRLIQATEQGSGPGSMRQPFRLPAVPPGLRPRAAGRPDVTLPSPLDLTHAQYSGWACCWCARSLHRGGAPAGRAHGSVGAHVLDVDLYECPPGYGCSPSRRAAAADPGSHHPDTEASA